jgi:TonB family protein
VNVPDPAKPDQHYLGGEPLEDFYPDGSVARGEEGPVVILLRISARGCATARAITVHSGYAPLDAAALQWIETAGFAPRRSGGKAVESYLSFKVGFRIKN